MYCSGLCCIPSSLRVLEELCTVSTNGELAGVRGRENCRRLQATHPPLPYSSPVSMSPARPCMQEIQKHGTCLPVRPPLAHPRPAHPSLRFTSESVSSVMNVRSVPFAAHASRARCVRTTTSARWRSIALRSSYKKIDQPADPGPCRGLCCGAPCGMMHGMMRAAGERLDAAVTGTAMMSMRHCS